MSERAAPVGFVCALEREARCLRGVDALVRVSGIGSERARAAARALVDEGARALASFGVAGGLDPELAAGALLLPDRVHDSRGDELRCDERWRSRVAQRLGTARGGTLLEALEPIADPAAKARALQACGALAVDMESAAVARLAREADIPFLCVRAVCDGASTRVPRAAERGLDGTGRVQPVALFAALAARPLEVVELFRLALAFRAATRSLERAVELAGEALLGPFGG